MFNECVLSFNTLFDLMIKATIYKTLMTTQRRFTIFLINKNNFLSYHMLSLESVSKDNVGRVFIYEGQFTSWSLI